VGGLGLPREPTRPLVPLTPDMTPADVERAHRENLGILMLADPARIDDLAVRLQIDNIDRQHPPRAIQVGRHSHLGRVAARAARHHRPDRRDLFDP
jgi:hypothetical protein